MKAQHQKIEIDAHAAFKNIGISLEVSPIGYPCVEVLKEKLIKSITTDLLLQSMMDAAKGPKSKRGQRKSDAVAKIQSGGANA
jgi:hypothetical protein